MIRFGLIAFIMLYFLEPLKAQQKSDDDIMGSSYKAAIGYESLFVIDDQEEDSQSTLSKIASRLNLIVSAGPKFLRFDPFVSSTSQHISSFSTTGLMLQGQIEYFIGRSFSIFASTAMNDISLKRYDGLDLDKNSFTESLNSLGLRYSAFSFYLAYELQQFSSQNYYVNNNSLASEKISHDVHKISVGQVQTFLNNFIVSPFLEYSTVPKFNSTTQSGLSGNFLSIGLMVAQADTSGFGLKIKEEIGEYTNADNSFEVKNFTILPFYKF